MSISVAAQSQAKVCMLRLWVRIPPGAQMSVMNVVCCQVEVSATGWTPVQRSPSKCYVTVPRPTSGHCAINKVSLNVNLNGDIKSDIALWTALSLTANRKFFFLLHR